MKFSFRSRNKYSKGKAVVMGTEKYDVMQICLNGHKITGKYHSRPHFRQKHCAQCGAETITNCPKCSSEIRGDFEGGWDFHDIPDHCENCGEQFPWTEEKRKLQSLLQQNSYDPFLIIEKICSRFHCVVRQLGDRYNNRQSMDFNDEYDVQDLLRALLTVFFDDIRPEEYTPSYAGGSSKMDFLLKDEKLVIEVKKTRKGLGMVELADQLINDKAKYRSHPDCKTLICFVYDPEAKLNNPRGLENDLSEESEDFKVKVIIVPKGY